MLTLEHSLFIHDVQEAEIDIIDDRAEQYCIRLVYLVK